MILDVQYNNFVFNFLKSFVPEEIEQKYKKYLLRIPEKNINSVRELLQLTVQEINIPGFGYEPVKQLMTPGREINWRESKPVQELFSKEINISFKLINGFINYWIMYEILQYYYSFDNREPFTTDILLRLLDYNGNDIVNIRFEYCLFNKLSDLTLNYAHNDITFNTFTATFTYNAITITLEKL